MASTLSLSIRLPLFRTGARGAARPSVSFDSALALLSRCSDEWMDKATVLCEDEVGVLIPKCLDLEIVRVIRGFCCNGQDLGQIRRCLSKQVSPQQVSA